MLISADTQLSDIATNFTRNVAGGTLPVVRISQDSTTNTMKALEVYQYSEGSTSGHALTITQGALSTETTGYMIYGTTGDALITMALGRSSTSGANFLFHRNIPDTTSTDALVSIVNDNTADDQTPLYIQNDGSGEDLIFKHVGASDADEQHVILFNHRNNGGTQKDFLKLIATATNSNNVPGVFQIQTGNNEVFTTTASFYNENAGANLYITRDLPTAAFPMIYLVQTNTTDSTSLLSITNAGTGYAIEATGKVKGDYYSSDGTAGYTGSCGAATTLTVKDGLITGCA